jgi:HEAT repeat protein
MSTPNLDNWITKIRNRDPMIYEDAYWGERPIEVKIIPRLLSEMHNSPDTYTRGKFLELLGEMGDSSVVTVLIQELSHGQIEIRRWAVLALEELGFLEGVSAAKTFRELHPEEFE